DQDRDCAKQPTRDIDQHQVTRMQAAEAVGQAKATALDRASPAPLSRGHDRTTALWQTIIRCLDPLLVFGRATYTLHGDASPCREQDTPRREQTAAGDQPRLARRSSYARQISQSRMPSNGSKLVIAAVDACLPLRSPILIW